MKSDYHRDGYRIVKEFLTRNKPNEDLMRVLIHVDWLAYFTAAPNNVRYHPRFRFYEYGDGAEEALEEYCSEHGYLKGYF